MHRVLGLDPGESRWGVALSDPLRIVASPHTVIEVRGDGREARAQLKGIVSDESVDLIVVGLPLSLDGSIGPAAVRATETAEALRTMLSPRVRVELYDERFTTVSAQRALQEGGVRGKASRQRVDKVAAAVLLQSVLDGGGGTA